MRRIAKKYKILLGCIGATVGVIWAKPGMDVVGASEVPLASGAAVDVVSSAGVAANEQLPTEAVAEEALLSFESDAYEIPYAWSKKVECRVSEQLKNTVTLVYTSSDKKVAKVSKTGVVTGVSEGTAQITVKVKEQPEITAHYTAVVKKEKVGLHTDSNGKKYCILKSGERGFGYQKVGSNFYFFQKSSHAIVNKWKYVTIGERKYKLYFGENGRQKQDVSSLIGKQSSYHIEVNIAKNTVIVYAKDKKNGYCIPVKAMVCSCGVAGHSTKTGNFSRIYKVGKWHPLYYGTYGKYCTRISGPYLFHSVVYTKNGDDYSLNPEEFEKLGSLASHGCIRLQVKDAKWIYKNAAKCSVSLFSSKEELPLRKPKAAEPVVGENGKAYDPTDADVK